MCITQVHQTYADSYGLLFSRAARQAIADLKAGRTPPAPPSIDNYKTVVTGATGWKRFLLSDMKSNKNSREGIGGVHCAIGAANQPGSTLLFHWLHPAEGSPFEDMMKERGGVTFVPENHIVQVKDKITPSKMFYSVKQTLSIPNNAVEVGDWSVNPSKFSAEAPRTVDQCDHVDGSTTINFSLLSDQFQLGTKEEQFSWVVWKVPEQSISIGRIMMCHPRDEELAPDSFDAKAVRFHYAVLGTHNIWRVVEDTQKNENRQKYDECCTVMIDEMNSTEKTDAWTNGLFLAIEWKREYQFEFDYLVAM